MIIAGDELLTIDDAGFFRWYGAWAQPSPREISQIMAGLSIPWWIAGGWAIDAFSGQVREHEDTDVAIFREHLPAVIEHLGTDYCLWSNLSGTLRPLLAPGDLLEGCRQIWVRRDAESSWLFDLLLTPHESDTWISVRDERIQRPLAESLFEGDEGIRYLRPELVLHLKARLDRPKDRSDLSAALPLLDESARAWLQSALEIANPGHQWLERLSGQVADPPDRPKDLSNDDGF